MPPRPLGAGLSIVGAVLSIAPPVEDNYLIASSGGRGERGERREEGGGIATVGGCNSGGRGWGRGRARGRARR